MTDETKGSAPGVSEVSPALRALIESLGGKAPTKTVDWKSQETAIKHAGREMILPDTPAPMSYDAAIDMLNRAKEEEAQDYSVNELVKGLPWDALHAVYLAMRQIYGYIQVTGTMTWFGPKPPAMLSIKTGPGAKDVVQVPHGKVKLPNIDNDLAVVPKLEGCYIVGTLKKRERDVVLEIARLARELVQTRSVYRGRAITIPMDENNGFKTLALAEQPRFIDTGKVNLAELVHSYGTQRLIDVNVFGPIRNTEACRANRIPLKRGVLLEGPYGTGKSMTALAVAKVAADNQWTFIQIDRAAALKQAIEVAALYQPAVVFVEDIDRHADRKNEGVNDLLNVMDGSLTKGSEIMVVLTTNHVERISQAMLRPGRLDAVISILPPDDAAIERLIRNYGAGLIDAKENLGPAIVQLRGSIAATIREVVERAKLAMLVEGRDKVTADDLAVAAAGMRRHLELLTKPSDPSTPQSRLWGAFKELIGGGDGSTGIVDANGVAVSAEAIASALSDIDNNLDQMRTWQRRTGDAIAETASMAAMASSAAVDAAGTGKEVLEVVKRRRAA